MKNRVMSLTEIKKILKRHGIDVSGVCSSDMDENLKKYLYKREKEKGLSGMEESDISKRTDVYSVMEDANSIITAAFPYYTGYNTDSNISIYCSGKDYHTVIEGILNKVCSDIRDSLNDNEKENFRFEICVDTSPLVDRYIAYMSGIGFFGLNNNIITEKYGSYVFIGYIITNLNIEKSEPMDRECIKCGKCIEMCPGKALKEDYKMDAKRCLSYITQKKGEFSEQEKELIIKEKTVFGCDVCQKVCPHNENIEYTDIKEFMEDKIYNLEKNDIDNLSNREFKRKYGDRAFSWRGKGIIKRNLDLIEENNEKGV
ncbi:tRNA epoxyqueuosine(34) reductase QueG [Peptacetobacter hominis]|nr:tRNA epoxyqueuosine(34) reductase QueG [Peptacetobacter hominis]